MDGYWLQNRTSGRVKVWGLGNSPLTFLVNQEAMFSILQLPIQPIKIDQRKSVGKTLERNFLLNKKALKVNTIKALLNVM